MEIRTASEQDIGDVLALWRDADAIPSVSDDPASVAILIGRDPEALIVSVDEGRIVGTIIAGWDGWRGTIYRLAVAPSHRRRRVAADLTDAAVRRLEALGAKRVGAIVIHSHEHATAYWQAIGFTLDERVVRYVKNV